MIRRKLKSAEVKKNPYIVWNAFIDLLAMEDESDLSEKQRIAHDAFWYDSEIQNGGHMQYFENKFKKDYSGIIKSLNLIGAKKQAKIFEKAVKQFTKKNRKIIETVKEYVEIALEGEYDKYDQEYGKVKPEMNEYLEKYLEKNKNEFIEIK